MNAQSYKLPQRLILSGLLFLGLCGFKASAASELLMTLQRENAALKKRAQDLRMELSVAEQQIAALQEQVTALTATKEGLDDQVRAARRKAEAAEARALRADDQTAQAVATLKELRSLIQKQADAVSAQKDAIAQTQVANQILNDRAEAARDAREKALQKARSAGEAAEAARREAIREEAIGHYNLGVILAGSRKSEAAKKQFLACLKLLPDDADCHYNLGVLYDGPLQDRSKAIKHYKRFIELAPDSDDAERVARWLENMQ